MATIPPAIRAAFDQANELWPNRNKASDGAVGDTAHQARPSDHNPGADGDVNAFDLTHDPAHGVDCNRLADVALEDPRSTYVIWNRRINSGDGRGWRSYTGPNPHDKHMHVSIRDDETAENDTADWWEDDMPSEEYFDLHFLKIAIDQEAWARWTAKNVTAHDTKTDKSIKAQVEQEAEAIRAEIKALAG